MATVDELATVGASSRLQIKLVTRRRLLRNKSNCIKMHLQELIVKLRIASEDELQRYVENITKTMVSETAE